MIAPGTGDLVAAWAEKKRIIFLGPSTAGVSRLQQKEHWCPYGQQTPGSVPDPSLALKLFLYKTPTMMHAFWVIGHPSAV